MILGLITALTTQLLAATSICIALQHNIGKIKLEKMNT
jgi:hypothetical protein